MISGMRAVFGRHEESAVQSHAEDGGRHDPRPDARASAAAHPETGQCDKGNEYLNALPQNQSVALAVAIR